jgi:hypothetical protein
VQPAAELLTQICNRGHRRHAGYDTAG